MEQRFGNKLSALLEPTEQQKERMRQGVAQAAAQGAGKRETRRKPVLAVALAACLVMTTAVAAVSLGLDEKFMSFLQPADSEQAAFLANGAATVDKTVANKSGSLTVRQVIGDSNLTYIFMDFVAPEGTVLDEPHYDFMRTDIDFGSGMAGYGITSLEDADKSDNKVSLVLSIETEHSLFGKKMKLEVRDFAAAETVPGELHTVLPGTWKVSFPMDFQSYATVYPMERAVELYGCSATLHTVSVSPIAVTIKLYSEHVREIVQNERAWEELAPGQHADQYPITIHYQDGTSETTEIFSGMTNLNALSGEILVVKRFEQVINDRQIESVEFFGEVLPIDEAA